MSCLFCETFTCYRRQMARRCTSDTFSMSEENARRLVRMATQIRSVTHSTLQQVENEAVPTILCDLLDGLAEGLIQELRAKLACLSPSRDVTALTSADASLPPGEWDGWQAMNRGHHSPGRS